MTTQLDAIIRSGKRKPLWKSHSESVEVDYRRSDIELLLRHRGSLLLVDRIEALNLRIPSALGRRQVRNDDPFLAGHFPGDPVYPGALQVEMIGQMCLCLLHFMVHDREEMARTDRPLDTRALKIHHASFVRQVLPGMDLEIQVQGLGWDSLTATFAGQLVYDGEVMSLALMEVYIVGE